MRENILHSLWKYGHLQKYDLCTTCGKPISILYPGLENENSGPDFLNAKIRIDNQLWVGNLEIHIKSSDWINHGHQYDENYNNVILHLVWEYDLEIYQENRLLPTVELKSIVSREALGVIKNLTGLDRSFINCEKSFSSINLFIMESWLERMFIEKLQLNSIRYREILQKLKGNWEELTYIMLCRSFGLKVNADAFESVSRSLPFNVLKRLRTNQIQVEALLLGQAQLLDDEPKDNYHSKLKTEYLFLSSKLKLRSKAVIRPIWFRLRPSAFPTIRLSQLADLICRKNNLFRVLIETDSRDGLHKILEARASAYWQDHFLFGKKSKNRTTAISTAFKDLLILNLVIPLKFTYSQVRSEDISDSLINLMEGIPFERNKITSRFSELRHFPSSAWRSQGLLHLWKEYCSKNNCLQCAVGNSILNRNM